MRRQIRFRFQVGLAGGFARSWNSDGRLVRKRFGGASRVMVARLGLCWRFPVRIAQASGDDDERLGQWL